MGRRQRLIDSAKTAPSPDDTGLPRWNLNARLARIQREFVEKLWAAMLVMTVVGVPVSLARAWHTGWQDVYTVHLALGAVVVLVYGNRRRMSQRWLAALLIGLFLCVGLPGVLTFGIAATGFYWLALSCLVANVLFSARTALVLTAGVGVSLTAIGWGFVSGHIPATMHLDAYQRLPSAWAMVIVVTGIFLFVVHSAFKSKDDAVLRLLEEVEVQRKVIERSAMHDTLTDLPTLRLAEDRTSMAILQARRKGTKMAVLFLDLDGFKAVNDTHGHDAGDAVLRQAASRMIACLRFSDTVARIGGDEFLILLPDLQNTAHAGSVAASLIESLSAPFVASDQQVSIGASIGIAIYPEHGSTGAELRRNADGAMYEAKRQGKRSYRYAQAEAAQGHAASSLP